ncbi:MAG: hypothetical protein R2769_11475 [Saprospiraceae bacterium]
MTLTSQMNVEGESIHFAWDKYKRPLEFVQANAVANTLTVSKIRGWFWKRRGRESPQEEEKAQNRPQFTRRCILY